MAASPNNTPYADQALIVHASGIGSPLPVPYGQKEAPPTGWTGLANPRMASGADVHAWLEDCGTWNICVRLAEDIIAVDVDQYGEKVGAKTIAMLEEKHGELPPTLYSSARNSTSGVRLYRIPPGLYWPSHFGQDVDVLWHGYRYMMWRGSKHPSGRTYRTIDQRTGEVDGPVDAANLPDLPEAWVRAFATQTPARSSFTKYEGPAYDDLDAEQQQQAREKFDRDWQRLLGRLDELHGMRDGESIQLPGGDQVGWEKVCSNVAQTARTAVEERVSPYDEAHLFAEYMKHVPTDKTFTKNEAAHCWTKQNPVTRPAVNGAHLDLPTFSLPDSPILSKDEETEFRTVRFTRASQIKIKPVKWLWKGRIALGTLALLAGREGIGKSTVAYTLAAQITRGTLDGVYAGQPRQVVVAASEDSWEHTIVPRLMGADADLDRVLRIDVVTSEGVETTLSLPRDIPGLDQLVREEDVALILLDPLMSRLASSLDTHKDAEVRRGLEPITKVADLTGAAVLGLIHVNKGGSTDPLNSIMGSRAFSAVARTVLYAMADVDDENLKHLGIPKNNLGSTDLPTLDYQIESATVGHDEDDGTPITTGKVAWVGENTTTIRQMMAEAIQSAEDRTAGGEARTWLSDFLTQNDGARAVEIKAAAKQNGITDKSLRTAREKLKVRVTDMPGVFPRVTQWFLPTREGMFS